MSYLNTERILGAERIALPKGEDNEAYIRTFEEEMGIEVPIPKPDCLTASAGGRDFFWLRSIDIPDKIDRGLVDAGLTGTDALLDYESYANLESLDLGPVVCRFSILTTPEDAEPMRQIFEVDRRFSLPLVWLPTSRPRALERVSQWNDWPLRAEAIPITGSVETYAKLLPKRAALADLVQTGETAAANGLVEAKRLVNVKAVVAMKS